MLMGSTSAVKSTMFMKIGPRGQKTCFRKPPSENSIACSRRLAQTWKIRSRKRSRHEVSWAKMATGARKIYAQNSYIPKFVYSATSGNTSGNLPATFRDSRKPMNALQASSNPSGKLPEPSGTAAKHQNGTQVFRQAFRNPSGSFRNSSQMKSVRFP